MTISNSIVLADNAYGTIASGLSTSDTALTFTTGHGARFPAVAAGQVLYACLLNSTNVLEEIQITAHVNGSDSATIVRQVGGTTAKAWTAGDRIEARISSTALKRLQDESMKKTTLTTADSGATYTGAMDVPGLGYVTGLVYAMTVALTNSGTTPTIALDGLSPVTVVLDGSVALAASQMPLNGLYAYDGTNFILLNPKPKQPTRQVFTGGSGTYTTPTGATRISIRLVGGGGGGGAQISNNGSSGNNTTFGTLTGSGGGAGLSAAVGDSAGGTASGGDINIPGASGCSGQVSVSTGNLSGGAGGNSCFGGAGAGGGPSGNGQGAATNSGSGGGGGGGNAGTGTGGGGGAGGYVEKLIVAPSATYAYAVGASSSGGSAGAQSGGPGAAGLIIVDEYYN